MAEARFNPRALAAVHELLGPGVSLSDISTWADEQRNPKSGAWHYVDVPITEMRYDPKFCPPRGCVVSKIEDLRQVLMDLQSDRLEKQQALKFMIHKAGRSLLRVCAANYSKATGKGLDASGLDTAFNPPMMDHAPSP
jgi:hypothetical protein